MRLASSMVVIAAAVAVLVPVGVGIHARTIPAALAGHRIASPTGRGAAEPNLAVGADGRVYMSWLEPADSGHALKFAVLNGRQWSAARTIRSGRDFFVNWADFPSIEVLGGSRLAAHWLQ